jgi:uncharacterized protein YndB with AHSA1/START domain
MADASLTASIDIAAPPERVYALLTDVDAYLAITAETAAISFRTGSGLVPGAVFSGRNDNGKRHWSTRCKVTDADGARFAFDVTHTGIPVARWQYDIVPVAGGSQVTESMWDRRPWWFKKIAERVTASPDRLGINKRNMNATLDRLKERAESS